jgi:hypothetical protein
MAAGYQFLWRLATNFRGPLEGIGFNVYSYGMASRPSCTRCGKLFSREDSCLRHYRAGTCQIEKPKKRKGRTIVVSPTNSGIFLDEQWIPVARGGKNEKWPCPFSCGKGFSRVNDITRHIVKGSCPPRNAQRSVLREGFLLNFRTPPTIPHPGEPTNSIEGGPRRGNVPEGAAMEDIERNPVDPEVRKIQYMKYREGVSPDHPNRYNLSILPLLFRL